MPIYGIDLGTTNSLLGVGDHLLTGLVPSIVNLDKRLQENRTEMM